MTLWWPLMTLWWPKWPSYDSITVSAISVYSCHTDPFPYLIPRSPPHLFHLRFCLALSSSHIPRGSQPCQHLHNAICWHSLLRSPATRQGNSLTNPPLPWFFPYPYPSCSFLCSSSKVLNLSSLLKKRGSCHLPCPCALTQMEVEMALFPIRLNALEANILSGQNNSK